jgi:hypothetical protein
MRKKFSTYVAPNVPRALEWVWQPSQSFGDQYQTFTGELYGGGGDGDYGPPSGLWFDGNDNEVQDDPRLHDYNLDDVVAKVLQDVSDQAQRYRTEHIMWTMGSDFCYQNAAHWFLNLDKIIHHVNRLQNKVNLFYSTPTIYTQWKHAANLTWEARTDDIMPYGFDAHMYLTGR